MKKLVIATLAGAALCISNVANAGLPVIDYSNLVQTTMTALQSLKTEVYQDTNAVYQYKMMANQLLQATGLSDAAMQAQSASIQSDIEKLTSYQQINQQLYGSLGDRANYLQRVQSQIVQSGKTPEQWFQDQNTLLNNGDATAKQLYSMGSEIMANNQRLAERRQQIHDNLNLSPTLEATAQSTNQLLDVISSQNSSLLQLMSAKAQADASKDQQAVSKDQQGLAAQQQLDQARTSQRQQLRSVLQN